MKLKAVFLLPVVAVLALPGSAKDVVTPQERLAAVQAELGLTIDPYRDTELHITLPTHFTSLDVSADPFTTGI